MTLKSNVMHELEAAMLRAQASAKKGDALAAMTAAAIAELAGLGQALLDRVRALEQQQAASMQYRGVYGRGASYPRGSCVTHQGGIWYAHADIDGGDAGPGQSRSWQLIVKG